MDSSDSRGRWLSAPRSLGRGLSVFMLLIGIWIVAAASRIETAPRQTQGAPATSGVTRQAVLDKYCVTCHNSRLRTAGLALDTFDVTKPSANADVWERVIVKLRMGSMPPVGSPRPDAATYRTVASWLEKEIDSAAVARPNPGRNSAVHRLNRTEYRNAVRDLFALDVDVTSLLPSDETSDIGFDNNSDVLSITTAHLERYMSAAREVTRLATGLASAAGHKTFDVPLLLSQDDRANEELPLGSRGGIAIRYYFPADGEYLFKVRLRRTWQEYILGMGTPHQLDIRVDGELLGRLSVGGQATGTPAPATFTQVDGDYSEWVQYLEQADNNLELRALIKSGSRIVGVSFVREMWEPEGVFQPRQAGELLSNDEAFYGRPAVQSVAIGGPYQNSGSGETDSRREIFVCQPRRAGDEKACATKILSRLARRAYRRPATTRDVQTLLGFFERGRSTGGSFDAGIQLALERLLIDPDFLLRIERTPTRVVPGQAYRLTDLELASRLSFFLWSSIPDQALLAVAERGKLTDPPILEQQVRRMLADPRAKTLVENFAAQWLHLRNLEHVLGDPVAFPDFDLSLVEAFRQETELFLTSMLNEDRSVLNLLNADYTFVNERLARHYGLPGIYGSRFRRVTLPNTKERGGLLGHGGVLALTSYPTRTSPVLRGKWLLDTIFGAPPPSPPPNVPALPERSAASGNVSVRERLEQHRKNPTCASCHAAIDPLGFALENFDALGAWRAADVGGQPIDATGTTLSGVKLEGISGLRALLLDQPEQFAGTVTKKLLTYALGRELEYFDQPTIRRIVRDASVREYRWSSLILGIVKSPAFLMRRSGAAN